MTQLDKDIIEFAKISSIAYGRLKENMELGKNFTNEFETNKIIINKFGKQEYKKETLNKKYKIIDIANNPKTGFQALALMDESGKYTIAFRGTNDKKDIKADIQIGKNNINPQHKDAKEFTQKILNQITKDKNIQFYEAKKYLTLVGHSLGGIHTQQIAAVNKIKGFAFNPYGANRLISMPKNPCFPSIGISTCDMSYALFGKFAPISKKIDEKWVNENIYTISYHDNGKINGDILSNFFTNTTSKHIGKVIPIIGKNVDFMQGHEIENLIKTLDEYAKISDNCNINFMQITKNRVNKDKFDKEILIKYADKKQTLPIYQNFCISKKQDFNSQEIISIENLDNDSGYKM